MKEDKRKYNVPPKSPGRPKKDTEILYMAVPKGMKEKCREVVMKYIKGLRNHNVPEVFDALKH